MQNLEGEKFYFASYKCVFLRLYVKSQGKEAVSKTAITTKWEQIGWTAR